MANENRLEFPIGITNYAHMALHFSKWKMPTLSNSTSRMERGEGLGTIYLYVPEGITDSVSTSWGQEDFTHAAQSAAEGQLWSSLKSAGASILGKAGGSVGQGNVNVLNAQRGKQFAPNQALVMQGPGYYDLSLQFDFAPENQAEAENIDTILKLMRRYSIPTQSGISLEYPPVVDVDIFTARQSGLDPASYKETKKNLFSYNNLVMTSFSASYAGDGGSMLYYHTGHPMNTKVQINLKSLLPTWNPEVAQ